MLLKLISESQSQQLIQFRDFLQMQIKNMQNVAGKVNSILNKNHQNNIDIKKIYKSTRYLQNAIYKTEQNILRQQNKQENLEQLCDKCNKKNVLVFTNQKCWHSFCTSCIQKYLQLNYIQDQQNLPCLVPKCEAQIDCNQIKQYIQQQQQDLDHLNQPIKQPNKVSCVICNFQFMMYPKNINNIPDINISNALINQQLKIHYSINRFICPNQSCRTQQCRQCGTYPYHLGSFCKQAKQSNHESTIQNKRHIKTIQNSQKSSSRNQAINAINIKYKSYQHKNVQYYFNENGQVTSQNDYILQNMPKNKKYKNNYIIVSCSFCQKDNKNIQYIKKCGGMYGPYGRGHKEYVHILCALWCHKVYLNDNGLLNNVNMQVKRATAMKCAICRQFGAGLICVGDCNTKYKYYHFKCAQQNECLMNWKTFKMLCSFCKYKDQMLIRLQSSYHNEDNKQINPENQISSRRNGISMTQSNQNAKQNENIKIEHE